MSFMSRLSTMFDRAKPVAYADTQHNSASQDRELGRWNPFAGSADADIMYDQATTRARACDLDRNEGLAKGYLDTTTSNVVGTGLRCKPNPDWRLLGRTPEWAFEWSRQVKALADEYLNSKDIDATRQMDAVGLAGLALRNMMMSGACLVPFYWIKDGTRKNRTCVRLVEADRLRNPQGQMDSRTMRGGVELDDNGAHIRSTGPRCSRHRAARSSSPWTRRRHRSPSTTLPLPGCSTGRSAQARAGTTSDRSSTATASRPASTFPGRRPGPHGAAARSGAPRRARACRRSTRPWTSSRSTMSITPSTFARLRHSISATSSSTPEPSRT